MIRGALIGMAVVLGVFALVGLVFGVVFLGVTWWGPVGPAFIFGPLFLIAAGVVGALSAR